MAIANCRTSSEVVLACHASGPITRSRTRAARALSSEFDQQHSSLGGPSAPSRQKGRQALKAVLHGILKKGGRKRGPARKKVSQPAMLFRVRYFLLLF